MKPLSETELERAFDLFENDEAFLEMLGRANAINLFKNDEAFLEMLGRANAITDYQPRQEVLEQASRYALRKAINNVLKGRES